MLKFRDVDFGKVITLDADGKLRSLRPIDPATLKTFDKKDPKQIATFAKLYDAYTGSSPIDERQAADRWLGRFNITADDPRYQAEFDRLVADGTSARSVLAEERRIAERAELLHTTGGNLDANCVYVNEGPNPCEECLEIGGVEMSLSDFAAEGMMPGDRCLGGDNCRCILVPINRV